MVVSGMAVVTTVEVCGEFAALSLSLLRWDDGPVRESVHDHDPDSPAPGNESSLAVVARVTAGDGLDATVDVLKLSGLPITKPSILMVDLLVVFTVVLNVVVVEIVVVVAAAVVLLLEMNGL